MSGRVVFEVGIIKDGIPIVQRRYFKTEEMVADPLLIGGLLSAIQDFTRMTFQDVPQVFQMAKYTACLQRVDLGGADDCILLYAICSSKSKTDVIRKKLMTVANNLKKWKEILIRTNIDTSLYERLYPILDSNFKPLNLDISNRVKVKLANF